MTKLLSIFAITLILAVVACDGAIYVDPVGGSDVTGDGTTGSPWATIAYAITQSGASAETLKLKSGTYSAETISSTPTRTSWTDQLTITPDDGAAPVLDTITIDGCASAYILWSGTTTAISTQTPQYDEESTFGFLVKGGTHYVKFTGCNINGYPAPSAEEAWKSTFCGISVGTLNSKGGYVYVSDCNIVDCIYSVQCYSQNWDGDVEFNTTLMHGVYRGGARLGTCAPGSTPTVLMDGCRVYDREQGYDGSGGNYHGTGIVGRCDRATVRNCIVCDSVGSGAIRWYDSSDAGADGYTSVLIENNLIISNESNTAMSCYRIGSDFVVRNNTIVSVWYKMSTARDYYYAQNNYSRYATGAGTGISFTNNFWGSYVDFQGDLATYATINHNFYHALKVAGTWQNTALGTGSILATNSTLQSSWKSPYAARYQETPGGLFVGHPVQSWYERCWGYYLTDPATEAPVELWRTLRPTTSGALAGAGDTSTASTTDLTGYTRPNPPAIGALEPRSGSLPAIADTPSPANEATEVSQTPTLSWAAVDGAVAYDVFIGTVATPTANEWIGQPTTASDSPDGTLYGSTTYYWEVVPWTEAGYPSSAVTVWSMTTEGTPPADPATTPAPDDDALLVPLNQILSWSAGSGAVSHNVYFGEVSGSLPLVSSEQAGTTYDPELALGHTYYWRIDEINAEDIVTTGTEWSFTAVPAYPVILMLKGS